MMYIYTYDTYFISFNSSLTNVDSQKKLSVHRKHVVYIDV